MSKKKAPKEPRKAPKTKEQIVDEMKLSAEVKRRRKIAREGLYPLLIEVSDSVTHASLLCQTIAVAVEQVSNHRLQDVEKKWREETKVSDLGLERLFNSDTKDPKQKENQAKVKRIHDLIGGETIASFDTIVKDFPNVIDGALRHQHSKEAFKDLDISFLD